MLCEMHLNKVFFKQKGEQKKLPMGQCLRTHFTRVPVTLLSGCVAIVYT